MKKLSPESFHHLVDHSTILEHDGHGPKVYKIENGNYLKIIRHKRPWLRLGRKPRAAIFARNARKLKDRGFLTIEIEDLFQLPCLKAYAVLYRPIPGNTLRTALQVAPPDEKRDLLQNFAQLLACLHFKGILFRSIHFANVIVTPEKQLGLIDIVDIRFHPFGPLSKRNRQRNFRHLRRYEEDRAQLAFVGWEAFLAFYDQAVDRNPRRNFLFNLPALFRSIASLLKRAASRPRL